MDDNEVGLSGDENPRYFRLIVFCKEYFGFPEYYDPDSMFDDYVLVWIDVCGKVKVTADEVAFPYFSYSELTDDIVVTLKKHE